ncbi:MAG TPA: hypothetical protein PLO14_09865 [Accumulibacter sp.]|uniref:hypothetical protein n=1 Tax=Accumulibacter sp. TaxID=2053492 RepID=UPI0025EAA15B|nr:hypothetical protein [Accumulibacter sp.]MCM8598228.1 hypothetical protein [Accumulibacter sp.]MCM8662495.1 hypothetical protein [Accumulibacter sp.]HNC52528.1 hypothetical protein [Accumulibacter sp.]
MNAFSCPRRNAAVPALAIWLLLEAWSASAADDVLGRLFFTPERRQQLDRQRESNTLDRQQINAEPGLTIDGVVTRSGGQSTVWINRNPQHGKEGGSDLQVTPGRGNPARVVVRADGSPAVSARVGDTIDRDTGQTHDLLDGGQLRVQSAPRSSR